MSPKGCPHGGNCRWWGQGFTGRGRCKSPERPVACNGRCDGWEPPEEERPSLFDRLLYGNGDTRQCHT